MMITDKIEPANKIAVSPSEAAALRVRPVLSAGHLRPDCYGRGIGTASLHAFFAICPVAYLRLDVTTDNRRAVKCYQKAGFTPFCYLWLAAVPLIEMEKHRAPHRALALGAVHGHPAV